MRLHLIIHRHNLPPVRILWSTPPLHYPPDQLSANSSFSAGRSYSALPSAKVESVATSFNTANTSFTARSGGPLGPEVYSYTISQLLQDVNELIPLETQPSGLLGGQDEENWGLEDYLVEVSGSECLHYMEVDALLRDGDEVVIRPLQIDDLAARRITGRHQVAADGTHLIDGVPFGRRYVKESIPPRPPIAIPPRKRRRIDPGNLGDDRSAMSVSYGLNRSIHEREEATKNQIGTIDRAAQSRQDSFSRSPTSQQEHEPDIAKPPFLESQPSQAIAHHTSRGELEPQGRKVELGLHARRSASPSYSSEESESELSVTSSESSGDESSEDESSSTSSTTDSSFDTSSVSDSSATSSSSEEFSESESVSNVITSKTSTGPTKDQAKPTPKPSVVNPPGKGSRRTRNSNQRAKLRRKLTKLKEAGILHKDANFADLRAWEAANATNGVVTAPAKVSDETAKAETQQSEFEKKRAELLRALEQGGVDISSSEIGNVDTTSSKMVQLDFTTPNSRKNAPASTSTTEALSKTQVSNRQKKLDMASAHRLLFTPLEIGVPEAKEDEEHTRNQHAAKTVHPRQALRPKSTEAADNAKLGISPLKPVENWQDFLILKATECVYDTVALSDPPFPFVQRWNSEDQEAIRACRRDNNRNNTKIRGKKRKRQSRAYDGENGDEWQDAAYADSTETSPALDYGESPSDDLPPLPADLSSRPLATESDVQVGAIIAFKQLDMSRQTNWQPVVSNYRTAIVEEVSENATFRICLAKRDRAQQPAKEENDDGSRIYYTFEMPGYEEEGEDDGIREVSFQDLIEPRLVRPSASTTAVLVNDDASRMRPEKTAETDIPDKASESIPENKPSITETPLSSQTRNDISNLIREAGFRSTIDSDLLLLEDNAMVSKEFTAERVDGDGDTPKFDADAGSPAIRTPTFVGFNTNDFPEHSKSSLEENNRGSHSSQDSLFIMDKTQKSTLKNNVSSLAAAQQLNPRHTWSFGPSEDGMQYLPEVDLTVTHSTQREKIGSSTSDVSPHSSPLFPPSQDNLNQEDQSKFSTLPGNVEESQPAGKRRDSNASSTVTNPFYEIDRQYGVVESDHSSASEFISSTAPARLTTQKKQRRRRRREAMSSPHKPSASPQHGVATHDGSDAESIIQRNRSPARLSQPPSQSAEVIDLTQLSEFESPGNSDGDYAVSRGLPRGSGWVKKKYPRHGRARSARRANTSPSRRGRGILRRSVI
ncbi:hypothetical protein VTO42DRAFT_3669 [Malbranchea cinnamomea]